MKFREALKLLPVEGGTLVGNRPGRSGRDKLAARVKVDHNMFGEATYTVSHYSWGRENGTTLSTRDVNYIRSIMRSQGYNISDLDWGVESVAPVRGEGIDEL
jgi:hypothetical protein